MLLMAPRRNHNTGNIVNQQPNHQQQQQPNQQLQANTLASFVVNTNSHSSATAALFNQQFFNLNEHPEINSSSINSGNNSNSSSFTMSPMQTAVNSNSNNTNNTNNNNNSNVTPNHNKSGGEQFVRCCYPNGDCFKTDLINLEDLTECIKVICNNENCNVGQYMHRECFEAWEQTVLQTLKTMGGRARSWSDRQKAQNLWTKKGYDLVYKVCGCKCSRGHLRKDLEWVAPKAAQFLNGQRIMNGSSNQEDEDKKKKKNKRNRQQQQQQQQQNTKANAPLQTNGHVNGQTQQMNGSSNSTPEPLQINKSLNLNETTSNNHSNVGVIGSGLHQNGTSQQINQTLQNQNSSNAELPVNVVNSLNNLLNGQNNILGLDLRPRTNSISSASNNSGSTSPSAISFSSGDLSTAQTPLNNLQNFNMNGFYHANQNGLTNPQLQLPQHQLHSNLLQQSTVNAVSLTKNILNGLQSSGLLGNNTNNNSNVTTNVNNNINSNAIITNASAALLIKQQQHQQQQQQQQQCANILSNGVVGLKHPLTPFEQQQLLLQQKVKEVEIYSERVRSTSGCNGIFSRRLDFSSFNLLPKTRLNSYQVKIEDEGNHGNDETRLFILSSLAQSQKSRVACILCEEPMLVFDRYPLVDGSFFLSPKQHSTECIEVKYEGRSLYLTCVCMRCLDGTSTNRNICCRFCTDKWDGSNLVLGTMYAYDIFAAMPCCAERLKCNNCFKLLLHPQQRLNFYSDYSHCVTCPYCATQDTHFVKPLTYCYTKSFSGRLSAIA
ncbi:headcase protein [Calliphora vicina]|uniref:headcase protein n=1 Tax=Calliphora vicina TaxID=7373 RepID=UPI00325C2808